MLYFLKLIEEKYYVGYSKIPEERILNHFTENGSEWTKKYTPIVVLEIRRGGLFDEQKYTLLYMQKYGIENVRGGSFSNINLSKEQIYEINRQINHLMNNCYICGDSNHYAIDCPKKVIKNGLNNLELCEFNSNCNSNLLYLLQNYNFIIKLLKCIDIKFFNSKKKLRIILSSIRKLLKNDDEILILDNFIFERSLLENVKKEEIINNLKNENNLIDFINLSFQGNRDKFKDIISRSELELGQTDICNFIKLLEGHNFIYKVVGDNYILYCFNGKYWNTDNILLRKFISGELYDFFKFILQEVYWNSKDFVSLKSKIERLKCVSFKKDIEETYKEYGTNNSINFDEKWYLFGFNNVVYDLEEGNFREYRYDDYISTTCGYDWREPTINEIKEVNDLIISIMPIKDERELFLQIMCTALDGKCLEKFVIFNGGGGNGKGVIDDLLLKALGNYGLIGNNGILFETSKTGSNPEKSNIHKKRLVIFREPSERNKFENSVIKELTGGGTFSARSHHEKTTIKELNLTMIVECNKRPLFAEEPQDAETRRIIDIFFRSTFTTDKTNVDNSNNIFLANPYFKTVEFQDNHKYALMKILFDQYKIYKKNNYIFNVPQSIKERTQLYLELSCNIVQWFKDNYQLTNDKNDTIKIKDLFEDFTNSEYYTNLSRNEKRKYNKSYFIEYIQNNIFFRKYYIEKSTYLRNFIREWKKKDNEENDDNE